MRAILATSRRTPAAASVWKVSPPAYVDLADGTPHSRLAADVLRSPAAGSREAPSAPPHCLRAGGAAARRLRLDPPPREQLVEHADVHRDARPSAAARWRPRRPVVNVYSADAAGDLSPVVRGDPALVYVPNSLSNTVDVISQRTLKIVAEFPVGALPQHVTPSYDLRTLYVDNDLGNSLTPIDPRTGRPGRPIPVEDPYNLYFTPDGRYAIVVAERLQRLDFRDPHTMRLVRSLPVPECRGVDHMDFSADGRYAFASCEFAGRMIEIDLAHPAGDPHAR